MRRDLLTLSLVSAVVLACTEMGDRVGPAADPSLKVGAGVAMTTLTGPVFGLATSPDGSLLAAETFVGVTEIRKGNTRLVAPLGGVTGVAPVGRGFLLAVTGEALDPSLAANAQKLFAVSRGGVRQIADLYAFEMAVNPDQVWNPGEPESNPFNAVQLRGGKVLVADAAGNDILTVDEAGSVDWVAVLTPQLASTAPLKALLGCDGDSPPPECDLPDEIPAQPVATSIAIGPDGHYYAGELTGFPSPPGLSRIWRIEGGSRHVLCPSNACTMVVDGLTSIVDLAFGKDGTLYVVELDEDGWLAVEITSGGFPISPSAGGTVKACNVFTATCAVYASDLSLPTALTVDEAGNVWVAENETIPGPAHVRPLP